MNALLPVSLSALLALSCSAEPPGGATTGPDAGIADDGGQQRPRIELDPIDGTTPWESVVVSGRGPARGTIVVETPVGNAAADIGSDGSFCLDVDLQTGIVNTLWVKGIDESGVSSDEIEVTVNQEGEPPTGGENNETLRNIARFGTVTHNVDLVSGGAADIVDGNLSSFAHFENVFANDDWIMIRLSESSAGIDNIKIVGTDECPLEDYYVMLSDVDDPGEPTLIWTTPVQISNENWEILEQVVDGAVTQVITPSLGTKPKAKYLALNGLGAGCEVIGFGDNEIKEIEVWTRETNPGGGTQGPSCASGGQ